MYVICRRFNHPFKFQDSVCNVCHDLKMLYHVRRFDYRCIIHDISKSEIINMLENSGYEDRAYKQNTYQNNQYQK